MGQAPPSNRAINQPPPTITIAPLISAWEYFNGLFNFDFTPLVPIGCRILIHNKTSTCASWAFSAHDGFYVGPALKHYRCFQVVNTTTKSTLISDTVEFRQDYLAQPTSIHADCLIRALHFLSRNLKETLSAAIYDQLDVISQLHDLFRTL